MLQQQNKFNNLWFGILWNKIYSGMKDSKDIAYDSL